MRKMKKMAVWENSLNLHRIMCEKPPAAPAGMGNTPLLKMKILYFSKSYELHLQYLQKAQPSE